MTVDELRQRVRDLAALSFVAGLIVGILLGLGIAEARADPLEVRNKVCNVSALVVRAAVEQRDRRVDMDRAIELIAALYASDGRKLSAAQLGWIRFAYEHPGLTPDFAAGLAIGACQAAAKKK